LIERTKRISHEMVTTAGSGAMGQSEGVETEARPEIPVDVDFAHPWGVTDAERTLHTPGDAAHAWPRDRIATPRDARGTRVAHTAAYAFYGAAVGGGAGARRLYSNSGFEVLAAHVEESTGYDFPEWIEQTVVEALDLTDLEVTGSPAAGYRGSVRDLLVVGR